LLSCSSVEVDSSAGKSNLKFARGTTLTVDRLKDMLALSTIDNLEINCIVAGNSMMEHLGDAA